jgi:hypothetical protein
VKLHVSIASRQEEELEDAGEMLKISIMLTGWLLVVLRVMRRVQKGKRVRESQRWRDVGL